MNVSEPVSTVVASPLWSPVEPVAESSAEAAPWVPVDVSTCGPARLWPSAAALQAGLAAGLPAPGPIDLQQVSKAAAGSCPQDGVVPTAFYQAVSMHLRKVMISGHAQSTKAPAGGLSCAMTQARFAELLWTAPEADRPGLARWLRATTVEIQSHSGTSLVSIDAVAARSLLGDPKARYQQFMRQYG